MYKMENIKMTDDKKYYCEMQLKYIELASDNFKNKKPVNLVDYFHFLLNYAYYSKKCDEKYFSKLKNNFNYLFH